MGCEYGKALAQLKLGNGQATLDTHLGQLHGIQVPLDWT